MGREPNPAKRIRNRHAEQIRATRALKGLSAAQLARAITELGVETGVPLSCTPAAVTQWETATTTPRPVMQLAIAEVLGATWLSLFSIQGETLR